MGNMKIFITEIQALDPHTGEMKTWCGDNVEAPTWELAQELCNLYKGYLKVVGELSMEIPCKENSYEPDWSKAIDYEKANLN